MKTYEDVARRVLIRAEEIKKQTARRRKKAGFSAVGVLLLCVGVLFAARLLHFSDVRFSHRSTETTETATGNAVLPHTVEQSSTRAASSGNETGAANATGTTQTAAPTTAAQTSRKSGAGGLSPSSAATAAASTPPAPDMPATVPVTDPPATQPQDASGGETFGGELLPESFTLGPQTQIVFEGTRITEAEAQAYLRENLPWISSALAQSGVPANALRASARGYSHLSLGEQCVVRADFRDYLLYNGDTLVSILTLYRQEDGQIHASPAFGGPWFSDFNAFLQAHRGEKLLFAYAGNTEIVITPANEVYTPLGETPDLPLLRTLDYRQLCCEEIAYVP